MGKQWTAFKLTCVVIIAAFAVLYFDFTFRVDGPGVSAAGTHVTAWADNRPGWMTGGSEAAGRTRVEGRAGGLFTVRYPYSASSKQQVRLFLINADEIVDAYEFFTVCVRTVPAVADRFALVNDRGLFLQSSVLHYGDSSLCDVVSTERVSVTVDVDPSIGTVVDDHDRTPANPNFTTPAWRAIDIGVADSAIKVTPGESPVAPQFMVDL